jgi:type 1 glutamine amidotransferase
VLGRPFGLRQLARNGKQVVLMRDMTDTMYDPQRSPFVSHFTGTDLIVEHIEKWVCKTVTSDQLLGGREFRFAGDRRPDLVIVTAEDEYRTEQTLPEFAAQRLGHDFRVHFVFANEQLRNDLPGIETLLEDADLVLLSVRRRPLPESQLAAVRRYLERGRPLVGIRTASHAFCLRDTAPPEGLRDWPEFDAEILGGHYTNHHGNGPKVRVEAVGAHPVTAGIDLGALVGNGSLYKVSPLGPRAQPLLLGSIPGQPSEPVAWTHTTPRGGRVFYTSLGHWDDFAEPAFQQLLLQGLRWAAAP